MKWFGWDTERADNMRTPGRLGVLQIGPLYFAVNTADEGSVAFVIQIGHWQWGWTIERADDS